MGDPRDARGDLALSAWLAGAGRDLIAAFRRTGADLPFGDPRAAHGVGLEGYYWRFSEPASGWSVAAICGVARAPDGVWAMVTLCAEPGGFERTAIAPFARTADQGLGVVAGGMLRASDTRLLVDLGPGARLAASLEAVRTWPRRVWGALGPAHALPGLGQYWTPHLLGARTAGAVELDGRRLDLADAHAYAEKNWGAAFAAHWWWGQASFAPDEGVAFAGGRLSRAGVTAAPTAVTAWTPDGLVSLAPPLARTVAAAGGGAWRISAHGARTRIELEGEAHGAPLRLPVPVPAERRLEHRSRHHLTARLAVTVRRGRRIWLREESAVAALEDGRPRV